MKIKGKIFLILFLLVGSIVTGQDIQPVKSVTIKNPQSVSLDRKGDIYIADQDGNINKYNVDGELLLNYSPQKIGAANLIESWFSVRVFAFYKDYQEFLFLDRFLTPSPVYTIPGDLIGFTRLATVANDDNIWIFDDTDMSLKKLDKSNQFLLLNIPLIPELPDPDHEINYMREYQNQLFINNAQEGVMVFDNLGNYNYLIPHKGLNYFNFMDDELYFLKESKLIFHHLYTQKERSIEIPSNTPYDFILVVSNRIIMIGQVQMDIYSMD